MCKQPKAASHRSKSARERAHLLIGAILASLARQNTAVRNDSDVLSRELLLKLADKPLLNPVEVLEKAEWHMNDDRFSVRGHLNLLG